MITFESDPATNIIELTVDGKITRPEIEAVFDRVHAAVAEWGSIRVLEVIRHLGGVEPAAIWRDLQLGAPVMKKVSRAAVVSDEGWLSALANVSGHFVPAEVRTFRLSELAEARAWLAVAAPR